MTKKSIVAGALLAMALAGCSGQEASSAAVDPQLAQKIVRDMPEAEVRKLLGEPRNIQALKVGDEHVSNTWYYGKDDDDFMIVMIGGKVHSAYVDAQPLFPVPEDDSDGLEPAENDA